MVEAMWAEQLVGKRVDRLIAWLDTRSEIAERRVLPWVKASIGFSVTWTFVLYGGYLIYTNTVEVTEIPIVELKLKDLIQLAGGLLSAFTAYCWITCDFCWSRDFYEDMGTFYFWSATVAFVVARLWVTA